MKTILSILLLSLLVAGCKKEEKPQIVEGELALPSWLADGKFYAFHPSRYDSIKIKQGNVLDFSQQYIDNILRFPNNIGSCMAWNTYKRGASGLFDKFSGSTLWHCWSMFTIKGDKNTYDWKTGQTTKVRGYLYVQEITDNSYIIRYVGGYPSDNYAVLTVRKISSGNPDKPHIRIKERGDNGHEYTCHRYN